MSARIGAVVRSFGAALAALFFSFAAVAQIGVGGPFLGAQPAGAISAGAFPLKAPDGTSGAPSYSFSSETTLGFYRKNPAQIGITGSLVPSAANSFNLGTNAAEFLGVNARQLAIGDSGSSTVLTYPAGVSATLEQRQGTTAQAFRIYGTTTGPKYLSLSHDGTNGVIDTAASSGLLSIAPTNATSVTIGKQVLISTAATASQLRTAQTTAPTCTTNCGTPGNVCVGTDTSMICTMGTTPASGVLITFNGTWAAAPSCVVQMALAGMVVGKQVLTAATTTTTITLVTNGTAPVAGDKYAIICIGVS